MDLEKQFQDGLQTNLNRTNHLGLGFGASGASSSFKPTATPKNSHIKFDDEDEDTSKETKSSTKDKSEKNTKYGGGKLNFVKSSS